jgi:hypothetical protein
MAGAEGEGMIDTLDIAWGIQNQTLRARQAAAFKGLDENRVVTWMTRPMWLMLIEDIKRVSPYACSHPVDPQDKQRYEYCGCEIRFLSGSRLISFSSHPDFLK